MLAATPSVATPIFGIATCYMYPATPVALSLPRLTRALAAVSPPAHIYCHLPTPFCSLNPSPAGCACSPPVYCCLPLLIFSQVYIVVVVLMILGSRGCLLSPSNSGPTCDCLYT